MASWQLPQLNPAIQGPFLVSITWQLFREIGYSPHSRIETTEPKYCYDFDQTLSTWTVPASSARGTGWFITTASERPNIDFKQTRIFR
jgi:hypothetical protein